MTTPTAIKTEKFTIDIQLGTGKGRNLLVVGESPAKNGWIVSGRAFHTPEGKLVQTGKRVNEYLNMFDLAVEQISFTEMVKYVVLERKQLETCALEQFDLLLKQITDLQPKIVITLGVIPNKVFSQKLNRTLEIGKMHDMDSYQYLPLYHPSPANPYGHKKNLAIFADHYLHINDILSS